ncbi:transcriptional regulator [Serratia sp. Leaf50]|nr:transcriptional regulator [Serratia sp. Leaf50]
MCPTQLPNEGLRERKQRETFERLTQVGLELFIANGYEETTLDGIASAAGISRRTIFNYFSSKDQILLAWQAGLVDSIRAAVLAASTDQPPLDAICSALRALAVRTNVDAMIDIAQVIRSSDQLRAANHAKWLQMEQTAFQALCQLWPEPSERSRLHIVAMASLGAFRIALDEWTDTGGKQPFAARLAQAFSDLRRLEAAGGPAAYTQRR